MGSTCRRKSGVWLPSTYFDFDGTNRILNAVSLDVDLLEDVAWNTDAFKFLVIEDRMKELVQAVVTNQIHAEESTDLIRGKGSGLTMLLHGYERVAPTRKKTATNWLSSGPGTGKTLTAERYMRAIPFFDNHGTV